MQNPNPGRTHAHSARRPVLTGLFTGTAVGAGYLLAGVPNVELMTLICAAAGAALGPRWGFVSGALAAAVFSLGSPYGPPVPWLLAAQILGMGCAAVCGAWLGARLPAPGGGRRAPALAAACGLCATTLYDLLTNLAIVGAFDLPAAAVAGGALPFYALHAGSNAVIFGAFAPQLFPRLRHLARPPLAAGLALGLFACAALAAAPVQAQDEGAPPPAAADSLGAREPAAADSLHAPPPAAADSLRAPAPAAAGGPRGWRRPLWDPYLPTVAADLAWRSPWLVVADGGLGAATRLVGEAGTAVLPLVLCDGLPLGTGHALADDPGLLPLTGMGLASLAGGDDGWGGSGGLLELTAEDPDPGRAYSAYWGSKGPHETYARSVRWLTPAGPWRADFAFAENLDKEGYNYTDLPGEEFDPVADENFPGHARIRRSRARLIRNLGPGSGLQVHYDSGRLTKDGLPALGVGHQEIWQDGLGVALQSAGAVGVRAGLYWRSADVGWGDRPLATADQGWRLLQTGREGVQCDLFLPEPAGESAADSTARGLWPAPPPTGPLHRLRLSFANWTVDDGGADSTWAQDAAGPVAADGREALVSLRSGLRAGGVRAGAEVSGLWGDGLGWEPGGEVSVGQDAGRPAWVLYARRSGRLPRSDETATALRHVVDGRELFLLPNADLQREETLAAGCRLAWRALGTDLAVDVALTRLGDGIVWVPDAEGAAAGRWRNALELDAVSVHGRVGRAGRFLGWLRVSLEGTWQEFEEKAGRASYLPPVRSLRGRVLWENHFFQEDGILQVGWLGTRTGEMADPWDLTRTFTLPERTVHDLIVSFRLVGANLSLAFRNLTGERQRLTSGAYGTGGEMDLRLDWTFRH